MRYFSIFPVLTRTSGDAAADVIIEQRPAAGVPLAVGGQLALSVSASGEKPQPSAMTAVEAPPETIKAEAEPASASTAAAPDEIMAFVTVSQAPAEKAPPLRLPSLESLLRPGLLWVWLSIAVAGLAILILIFRGKHRLPEQGFDRVAKVTARLEYGPGRLNAHGPLIVGRESGQ